jgi:hypothetical protein
MLRAMDEAGAHDPPRRPLPTVAHDRGHGITSVRVYCAAELVVRTFLGLQQRTLFQPVRVRCGPRAGYFLITVCWYLGSNRFLPERSARIAVGAVGNCSQLVRRGPM